MTVPKKIILLFFVIVSFIGFSQSKIGQINDKDGYVNIRVKKSSTSEIIGKILEQQYFTYFEDTTSNWWVIESKTGLMGYVHKSRISFVKNGYLQEGKLLDKIVGVSVNEYFVNEVAIHIYQLKPLDDYFDFSCKGLLRTIKRNKLIAEINYQNIEPVGGNYGISFSEKQMISSLFIAVKSGDYKGEILIVDLNGNITTFEGGQYFITNNGRYLVSTWDSDLSGLSIYDLEKKQIRFNKELERYLGSWYYSDGIYYAAVWNGEKEVDQTMQIDFKGFQLKNSLLKKSNGIKVEAINQNCECK